MTRLNSYTRNEIVKNAIEKSGVNERRAKLTEMRADWIEQCRIYALGGARKARELESVAGEIEKILKKVPDSITRSNSCIRTDADMAVVIPGHCHVNMYWNGLSRCAYENMEQRIAPVQVTVPDDHRLAVLHSEMEVEQEAIDRLEESIKANVRACVNSVTTTKKLLEIWPEASELLPSGTGQKANLPAIQTDQLNTMIGLPSEG